MSPPIPVEQQTSCIIFVPSIVSIDRTYTTASSTISSRSHRRHFPKKKTTHPILRISSTNNSSCPPSSTTTHQTTLLSSASISNRTSATPLTSRQHHHHNHTPTFHLHTATKLVPQCSNDISPATDAIEYTFPCEDKTEFITNDNTGIQMPPHNSIPYSTITTKAKQRDPCSSESIPNSTTIHVNPLIVQIATDDTMTSFPSRLHPDCSVDSTSISAPVTNVDHSPTTNIAVNTSNPRNCSKPYMRRITPPSPSSAALCQEYNYAREQQQCDTPVIEAKIHQPSHQPWTTQLLTMISI